MGIPFYFKYLSIKYPTAIARSLSKEHIPSNIDALCVDMNGLIHEVAQRTYKYGAYEIKTDAKLKKPVVKDNYFFNNVVTEIDRLILLLRPRKRVLLCIDGVAGVGKEYQQRMRRYRPKGETPFNTNQISVATSLMGRLVAYLNRAIKERLVCAHKQLHFILSSDKVSGEGEHKLISFIRRYRLTWPDSSYITVGLDADLVMLNLSLYNSLLIENQFAHFYVYRESTVIDINELYNLITGDLVFDPFNIKTTVSMDEYIFLCFLVGNDFLPHIPSLHVMDLDCILDAYKKVAKHFINNDRRLIDFEIVSLILQILAQNESKRLIEFHNQIEYPDPLVINNQAFDPKNNRITLNYKKYLHEYYAEKIPNVGNRQVVNEYLKGMCWVYNYYLFGMPDWRWSYPYNYAPLLKDLAHMSAIFIQPKFRLGKPLEPLEQLLSILPPKDKELLPVGLQHVMDKYPNMYPTEVKVDETGIQELWQSTVLVPRVNHDIINDEYTHFKNTHDCKLYLPQRTILIRHDKKKGFLVNFIDL